MEKLAKAIKLAAKYHEESYDQEASDDAEAQAQLEAEHSGYHGYSGIDFNVFYRLSIKEAADKAASDMGYDARGSEPIYLLLKCCWNDILDWAKLFD